MKRTLPVSMYLLLICGKTLVANFWQWPQVIDAYSTIVTLASLEPSATSSRSVGFISSSTGTSAGPVAFCAILSPAVSARKPAAVAAAIVRPAMRRLSRVARGASDVSFKANSSMIPAA